MPTVRSWRLASYMSSLESLNKGAWQNIYDSVMLSIAQDGQQAIVDKISEYALQANTLPKEDPQGFLYLCAAYCIAKAQEEMYEKQQMMKDFDL